MVSVMENNLVFTMHAGNKEFGQGKNWVWKKVEIIQQI